MSATAHKAPLPIRRCSSKLSISPAHPLLCQLRTVKRKASLPSLACQTAASMVPLTAEVPKSRLHRSTKASAASQAQLISHAQQLGIDHSGTKKLLVDRIHAALSTNVAEDIARQEEVQKLQAEVAQLDAKLAEVNQVLATATVAREDERQQLASVTADMSTMREKWQTDVNQVEELAAVAGNLEQSERDILTLRSQQGRFDERIVMMQHLLEERELEVVTLKAQLSEFRQPALALAGGPTTWDADTSQAAEPLRGSSSSFANASWANNWSSGVIRSADGGAAVLEAQPQALTVLQSQLSPATVRTSRKRQHTMPGLAIVAAVAAAAQKGGAFWGTVKSLLPQEKRGFADAILAAGTTALMYSVYM
ncbi:hypothetical protein WJX82_009191 [Trebouxia sp. C0006]